MLFNSPKLHHCVLDGREKLYTPIETKYYFVIRKLHLAKNPDEKLEFIVADLTDGFYRIPAIFAADAVMEATNRGNWTEALLDKLVCITKMAIGIYRRNDQLAVHLIASEFRFEGIEGKIRPYPPEDICLCRDVRDWLQELQYTMPGSLAFDRRLIWIYLENLFSAQEYQQILPVFEYIAFRDYGLLPNNYAPPTTQDVIETMWEVGPVDITSLLLAPDQRSYLNGLVGNTYDNHKPMEGVESLGSMSSQAIKQEFTSLSVNTDEMFTRNKNGEPAADLSVDYDEWMDKEDSTNRNGDEDYMESDDSDILQY
ncbi:hypothetical protein DFQ28_005949 [Apophysomyces sp. BC1034]|nr:hypothetical protein DFQ29_003413 [Apophysomyces sp. BC1021]KAG0187707.1 hypothetical protein DFQ28_005949 [Apophysomyces sp. BC1034]